MSSLGLFSFLAFLGGLFLVWRRGKDEGLDEEKLLDVAFVGLLVGILTGRLLFVLEHWPDFGLTIGRWLDFTHYGGLSFLGVAGGVWLVLGIASHQKKWNFWAVSDLAVFGVIWAQILVRIGQFLDGSYLGRTTDLPIGVGMVGAEGNRFPTQLIEAGFLILVFLWLRRLEKQYRLFIWYQDKRGEAKPGFLVLTFGLVYGLFRFGLAFFRSPSVYWVGLSLDQWVSLGAVLVIGGLFWGRMGKWEEWLKQWRQRPLRSRRPLHVVLAPKVPEPRRRRPVGRSHIKTGRDVQA